MLNTLTQATETQGAAVSALGREKSAEHAFRIALALFGKRGYDAVSLSAIADAATLPLDELYALFPRKESFIVRLYEQFVLDMEVHVAELPDSTVADRFRSVMELKLQLVQQHASLLSELLPAMLSSQDRLSVMGASGNRIRSRVQAVFRSVVLGATDYSASSEKASFGTEELVRWLYFAHLGLVFISLQADSNKAKAGLELAAELIRDQQRMGNTGKLAQSVIRMLGLPDPAKLMQQADSVMSAFTHPIADRTRYPLAENVLRDLFRFRRLQPGYELCSDKPCEKCLALHVPRIAAQLEAHEPVQIVLPAFPAKSPNTSKVIGDLPDFGEELALRFLQKRCDAISEMHTPGAQLKICSDGRVFGDIVGVEDDRISAYRRELIAMIERIGAASISVFDLDDVLPEMPYDKMRIWLVENYGEPIDQLSQKVKNYRHHREMFNGVHRFMLEDLVYRQPKLSRTQARKQSKALAYQVIQRSNAWSRLVAGFFPTALRLSIHPQPAHSDKIGIALTDSDDPWLTPWHGVALLQSERFTLTRRADAESLGARLIERFGRPSHFAL